MVHISAIDSTGDNALNVLEAQVVGSTHIFIFGEPYMGGDRLGMHNIHYNQGDPPGIHQHDDGIWQMDVPSCNVPMVHLSLC